ncbi:hypothetical protein NBT05_04945 [Aquimarina sp. ERC-38]|uniref:hypothetical protein n=1 Tax=Aquimarina sp. ERC-38 TaxID=2949996 RepID=UPI002246F2E0|nr:hypothetical protein [Aquimarina sp. ERC-38]UZO81814.1 hypothetical protein NBT05_04945 [Aquimarina sp. ERC-38]
MDVQADIKWIQNELNDVKDPLLIEAFKNLLTYRRTTKTTDEDRISIEQYNQELDVSISQIDKGEFYTSEEMKERISQWGKG